MGFFFYHVANSFQQVTTDNVTDSFNVITTGHHLYIETQWLTQDYQLPSLQEGKPASYYSIWRMGYTARQYIHVCVCPLSAHFRRNFTHQSRGWKTENILPGGYYFPAYTWAVTVREFTFSVLNLASTLIVGMSLYQDALKFLSREVLKLNGLMIKRLGAWLSLAWDLMCISTNITKPILFYM